MEETSSDLKTREIAPQIFRKRFYWMNTTVGPIRIVIRNEDHDPSKEQINQELKFRNFNRLSQASREAWIKHQFRRHAILFKRSMLARRGMKMSKVKEDILCQAVQGMQLNSESLVAKGNEESSKKDTNSMIE